MQPTAAIVPKIMKGILRFALSLKAPNRGSIKSARILSSDIMNPANVSPNENVSRKIRGIMLSYACLLYTSDAADDLLCVDLGGRRIITKKKHKTKII